MKSFLKTRALIKGHIKCNKYLYRAKDSAYLLMYVLLETMLYVTQDKLPSIAKITFGHVLTVMWFLYDIIV